jgi:FHA domain
MTATCPAGHVSTTTDYCDQCGARIGSAEPAPVPPDTSATSPSPVTAPCPRCGVPRTGRDRYCESCGLDFTVAASASAWAVTVGPDREYFARAAAEGLAFPADEFERTIALDSARVRIGRRRPTGEDAPEIELGDPAVSRLHATLVNAADGSWAVVDEGSSNGTTINARADPIAPHVEVPLSDGDRIHVGAWTTITLALRSRAA